MPPQQSAAVSRRSLESISIFSLLATLIAALFIFIPSASVPAAGTKTFVLVAGTVITLALYIISRFSRGSVVLPPTTLVVALWLPVAGYLMSALFSGVAFDNAFWGTFLESDSLGFMLVAACLGTLAAFMLRKDAHYLLFLKIVGYALGVLALLQLIIVVVGQVAPNVISPAFSPAGSFTDLAQFMGLGVILVLITYRFFDISKRARRILLGSGTIALALLAAADMSFVWGWVALVSFGLLVEALVRHSPKTVDTDSDIAYVEETPSETEGRRHSLTLPLCVLVVAVFFLVGGSLGSALSSALHTNVFNVRPLWQSTFAVAHNTLSTSPLFGSGPGTFGAEWLKYRDSSFNSSPFWNIDFTAGAGFIPTSLVTTGIVGALAWLGFLGVFLALGLRTLIVRPPRDTVARYAAVASFTAAVYLFSIAMWDLPGTLMLALAFVFTGIFASTMRFSSRSRGWGISFRNAPRLGFAAAGVLTALLLSSVAWAYTLVEHYIAEVEFTQATAAFNSGNIGAANQAVQKSLSLVPTAAAYQLQAGIAAAELGQIMATSTAETSAVQQAYQTTMSAGIRAALAAASLDPSDYQTWVVLGNLYAQAVPLGITGAYDTAKASYGRAAALNPTNPQIPYIVAQLDIANKNIKSAKDDLNTAIALKGDYTAAIFLISQLEVQDGNAKNALASALSKAYFSPNDPNVLFQVGILYAATNDLTHAAPVLAAAVAADPQFTNARYFLAAVYAKLGDFQNATNQLEAIASLSGADAQTVAPLIEALKAGKNPFPENLLTLSSAPAK
jgi:tetratricopeptide (TPR) repeat protein